MSNNAGPVLRHGGKQEGGSQQPPFYPAIDMDVYLSRDDRVAIRNKLYPDTPGKRPVQTAHLIPVFVSLCTLISLGATRNRLSIIDVFDQLLARLRDGKAETRLDDLNISVRDGPVQPATVWRILTSMIGLPTGLPLPTGDVRTHVQALFSRDENSSSFSVSLIDLMTADVIFVPTTKLTEHLTLDGKKVKILQLDGQRARFFHSFHENQLANTLGLSRLGQEVLASIWALLDKDIDMIPVVEGLGLIKISNDFEREFLQLSFQDLPTTTNAEVSQCYFIYFPCLYSYPL
ncbi:hypothetical protein BD779DRAFT_1144731 [Infundibulicybe gibba]|nr:hypothetical protein BD779DRAFT_1144731 [Infundibulicybe gibba]